MVLFSKDTNNSQESEEINAPAPGATFFVRIVDKTLTSNSAQGIYAVQVIGTGGVEPILEKPQNFKVSFTAKGKALIDGRAKRQFGSVKSTNKMGNMRTITITNTGTKPLKKLRIVRDGANAKDFIVKGYSRKPLKKGASITVYIYFKPKSSGQSFADLHIFSSETPENPFDLTLAGTGVGRARKDR